MDKFICQSVNPIERAKYISDSCDKVESIGYMKQFDSEELDRLKGDLSETSISIKDIELEKKEIMAEFKERLKPLLEDKEILIQKLKRKAEFVNEDCYKFIDRENNMVGYYNRLGILVEERGIRPEERQLSMFDKTGTND